MVERGSTPSKRLANTGSGDECHFPQDDDFHGRFGSGLGDKVGDTGNVRPLDTGGEIRINKRQRIEDDPLCTPTPCKKRPKFTHQSVHRQHHSVEIRQETRRNIIANLTTTSTTDTRVTDSVEHIDPLRPHTGKYGM